jgi:hypothetical protein
VLPAVQVLTSLAAGAGTQAAARAARFPAAAASPGRDGVRVFCASDLHVDAPGGCSLRWLRSLSRSRFQSDVVVVAGALLDVVVGGRCIAACSRMWWQARCWAQQALQQQGACTDGVSACHESSW